MIFSVFIQKNQYSNTIQMSKSVIDFLAELAKLGLTNPNKAKPSTTESPSVVSRKVPKAKPGEEQENVEGRVCIVCLHRRIRNVCNPCGHAIMCNICAKDLAKSQETWSCPKCKTKLESVIRLFTE